MNTRSISETLAPTAEVQRQLDMAFSQLSLYARDLKRTVDAERKKTQELAEAYARVQILDRLKTDFLTFISHELRTPLSSTLAAVGILNPHGDPQEQAQVIDIIRRGFERLDEFIEKGLEYFNWLASERVDTSEITDLAMVVQRVAERIPGLAEPGVDFRVFSPGVPCLIRGEERHLMEVVQTLLNNALKFSQKEKCIRVDLQATAERVTLAIADHGQGFLPELAQELFQPFTITDVMHHSQGMGLNLALTSAIVQTYGGQIQAKSKGPGKGATFMVDFPALSLPQRTTL